MMKNVLLFIVLLILGGIAYFFLNKDKPVGTIDQAEYRFSIDDVDQIYKLFIADRQGQSITLQRGKDYWTLDNKYRVNESSINSTLDAMKNLDVSSIPPRPAYENVMKEIATNGVKVESYNKSGQLIKSYYIGGASADGYQTQIIMEGKDQPYYVQIKGALGEVRPRFLKKYDDWKDPFIFRGLSEEIDTFSVYYHKRRSQSFIITEKGGKYNVQPAFETTSKITKPLRQDRVRQYLYDIDRIAIEAYFNDNHKIDELKKQPSVVTAYLKKKSGDVKTWDFIPHGAQSDISPINSALHSRMTSKYILVDEKQDALLGQEHLMRKIFWGYSSFYDVPMDQ